MIEIYWFSGSPHSWRVMLGAVLKQVDFESKLLEYSRGDTKTPTFRGINPRGRVPLMRDGDVVLSESLAILYYLDGKSSAHPLFGRTRIEGARILRTISEFDHYVRDPVRLVLRAGLSSPESAPPASEVAEATTLVHDELATLDRALDRSPWLAGELPSAADLAVFPFVRLIQRVAERNELRARELGVGALAESHRNLGRWITRIEAIPGYERTFPPHWRS